MAELKKILMPSASFVVARSYPDQVIGCDNQLPWKLRTDLRRFRKLTEDHVVIMGRKTLDSIGRPLPNRVNIVVTRSAPDPMPGVEFVKSLEDAVFLADFYSICRGRDNFFVIGGDQIYSSFLEKEMYNKIYLTEVFSGALKGDAFFRYEFDMRKWNVEEEIDYPKSEFDEFPFRFVTYSKRARFVRYRTKSEFMTDRLSTIAWQQSAQNALKQWEQLHPVSENDGQSLLEQSGFRFAG